MRRHERAELQGSFLRQGTAGVPLRHGDVRVPQMCLDGRERNSRISRGLATDVTKVVSGHARNAHLRTCGTP